MRSVAVLGGGLLGQAAARLLGAGGAAVRVWVRGAGAREKLKDALPNAVVTGEMGEACEGVALVFFAVPATAVEEVALRYGDFARGDHIVVHAARGVAPGFVLPSAILRGKTCVRKIGVIGG